MKASKRFVLCGAILVFSVSCQQPVVDNAALTAHKFLYVASGQCYSGNGITTFSNTTSSNLIFTINTETGVRDRIIADFSASPASAGDTPSSIVDWDQDNLLVYVRVGTTARLETLPKKGGTRNSFGTTPALSTFITTAPKSIQKSSDGGALLVRTGFIEKVTASGVRSGTPFVNNALGATCGTANALLTDVVVSATGRVITANGAASPNNRLISVPAAGANGSCAAAMAAPITTTYPVAMVFDKANSKLIVAYAGSATTVNVNSIYAYNFDESTGVISNAQKIYDLSDYPTTYNYLLYGISAMTLDAETNTLYVATAISTATTVVNYAIEKFSYNAAAIGTNNATVLTKSGSLPFYNYGIDTKCISSMVVGTVTETPAQE
ncbi:hypothetical protein AZI86_08455 [Bdellovibrio bacteriovorus]|uniref:Lipoprotein n=1 Tax=Bdellovibrio bacteriovorus TaxID=959 RepID=A0A150WRM7_BDEBC|nr:hypothetical protein [Bdellovibrio bacteriovorus]KYG67036.1 hypothetical protein AZI86_08455 [Bdellovibrio bacteriovorus]